MKRREALGGRLARLKKEGLNPPLNEKETKNRQEAFGLSRLEGWTEINPCLWRRSVRYDNPLDESYSRSLVLPADQLVKELIFYDTETTGLSTGAGTIPFLIGIGMIHKEYFDVIQLFLSDYPGEIHLLKELNNIFQEEAVYVSYNGKTYDSHLINTRFLMNGLKVNHRFEVDLLYPSRRLWKKILTDCRLGSIEKDILGINRGPDIPGAEIPDVWFDFLKNGKTEKLERVFSHNLQDIYSLAILLHTIELITDGIVTHIPYDRFALGKLLLFHKRDEGIELLERELKRGNRKAGEFLSLYWKRMGEWEKAVDLWKEMNKRGFHYFSVEELAKYYEHHLKDYGEALKLIDKILKGPVPPSPEIKDKLLHRKKRLIGRLAQRD
ncbi:MAG: hypothetical protein EH225_13220 [Calditrichaeota bacterium]|nr:ribonuclease H-like domain-containing protein [Spirochaetales bacterium]RQV98519.1 MAG: hypothetical protein EH225_13220 [Calditrichota bacterium]